MTYVELFVVLQALDFLTTVIGLRLGTGELSPFVRWLMHAGPVVGLVGAKLVACGLGAFCLRTNRMRVILRMNYFFSALVVWNLVVIVHWIAG